ncbi:hypothetical protein RhiirA4_474827 [Rhizophagus irregularis]|uniref:Uncharacterized protein n=1 Tax=Rhizophagus irregularis TaxID=588596 RepID=A0A2I1H953_9GLOM|nr:hypothetical protein RhiirA4_474827 [Rhizophagus irregularis]
MVDNKLLPKLSQNLLEILNDEEYYDITIEVGSDPYVKKIIITSFNNEHIMNFLFLLTIHYLLTMFISFNTKKEMEQKK